MYNPKYHITDSILKNIAKITEIKGLIENAKILPEREMFLRKLASARIARSSTSIEGNTLLKHEVEAIQNGKKINAERKQILEVKNYFNALKKIDTLSERKNNFDIVDILKLHKIVLSNLAETNKIGSFRNRQVYIVNISKGIETIAYIPPKARCVQKNIEELLDWMNQKNVHPIIKAGIFHYQFETIHPFFDGNGRTGRLLTLLNLYQSGYQFRKILVLEDYYNSDRKKYYENLQTGENFESRLNCDLTGWLEYFVEGFLFEAQTVKDQILSLKGFSPKNTELKFLKKNEIAIIDYILSFGEITSNDVVDIFEIPKRTAQDRLKNMLKKRIIKKKGQGPMTSYILY